MSTGLGIAIAGVWMFPAASAISKTVTGAGYWIAFIVAGIVTAALVSAS